MQALHRLSRSSSCKFPQKFLPTLLFTIPQSKTLISKPLSTKRTNSNGDDEWDTAWETAWLPDDLAGKHPAPWESDVNFGITPSSTASGGVDGNTVLGSDADPETKAFVEDMNENWDQRKGRRKTVDVEAKKKEEVGGSLYDLENIKKDYRLKKQRVHAGLWMKEIEKLEESKLGGNSFDGTGGSGDEIGKLLDSCSEIFDSPNDGLGNTKIPSTFELKNKPDGWETTSKTEDGNVWDMSQREEDILIQEFERRMAFCKFQIASFIKSHIFSRRRPLDGWKYMIEEIGPNARKGKGSAPRVAGLADPATQPFREEMTQADENLTFKRR